MARNEPTIANLLQELAAQYNRIVAEREVYDHLLALRPSQAKDPYASIRNQLRFGAPRLGWVWLGGGELVPLHVALQDLRFRLIPEESEITGGALIRDRLRPFIPYGRSDVRLRDGAGRPIETSETSLTIGESIFGTVDVPAMALGSWFQLQRFAPGDSLLVTVRATLPLTLYIEHEPAALFRADDVVLQDRRLLDELAERVGRGSRSLHFAEDIVLPIYVRSVWRTAYPGRPWRQLVANDRRLRLIDDSFVADSSFRRPLDWILGADQDEQTLAENDSQLLDEIKRFQSSLLASRRDDAQRGVWSGVAPRASTARVIFDMRAGTTETIYPGVINALLDHSADIEEHVARGDYLDGSWDLDTDLDDDDFLLDDDELFDLEDTDDLQAFIHSDPELSEAAHRLMDSLTPEELARLQQAKSPDEAQQILASRLTELLKHEPSLFVPLEPPLLSTEYMNGNGHANGNGHVNGAFDPASLDAEVWDDNDLFDDEDGLGFHNEGSSEQRILSERAMEHSNELIERFYQHQLADGKSETTAGNRSRDLWLFADFLSSYYQRSLDQGDYATLDEHMFFHYPRKVLSSSSRAAREFCTSAKQFYAFLKAQNVIADDAFAVAIWRRRDQAGRIVGLYEQLDSDSPQFERQFAYLFAPYTV